MSLADIIPWPKGIKPGDLLSEMDISDIIEQRIPPSLLDRAASATTGGLTSAHDEVKAQDAIISEAQERRRQAMIVIAAFEPAQKHLVDGLDQPNPLPAPQAPRKGEGRVTVYYNEIDPYAAQWLRNLIGAGHIAPGDVDERSIIDVRPDDLRDYTQCHFFAGIGGWSYAARLAGWPDDRALWTGSCPCQPFSVAGKQEGQADERHLWPIFFALINSIRPDVVMGEQVAAAVKHGWLDGAFSDLEGAGYTCGAAIVSASAANAPHRRDRLWFVADTQRNEQPWKEPCVGPDRRVGREQQLFSWEAGWQRALAGFRALDNGIPRCVAATDAARNAIVPQVAAEVIAAYLDLDQASTAA